MIDVQNLTKYYNDFCAVDHISLTVQPGEILGLLGPNGAGKTTTLRMLTGFFKPSSGSITINGLQMGKDSLKIKSLIGYLPESAPLYHNMLVYDYLTYVAKIKGLHDPDKRQARFRELVKLCGISDIMGKPIATLSKGLRQRVGIAHAMVTDPEILILDEPTSGLDPNQIAEIRDIIRSIGKEKTIIFSTHILSEAEATCDRIAIINKGRVVANDTTSHLKQNATQASLIRLSLSGPTESQALDLLKTIDDRLEIKSIAPIEQNMVSFEIRNPDIGSENTDIRSRIYMKIKETDWTLTELAKESQALEKIFQELTREEV
ncbi:MAG: ABC transporter ATP-binding protein [Proteobacteria bacterium]|nr:ABC transporter ATP-binding protein [Pseudomonadota bacterium]MBU4133118.1 ABC transporter ATP-binding protein [Pseudomonadota bacterium]